MEAKFICKPVNYELKDLRLGTPHKFLIMKEIVLSDAEFEAFENDPLQDAWFVKENKDLMDVENEVRHCILIKKEDSDYGYLIEAEGYDYPRYVAYLDFKLLRKEIAILNIALDVLGIYGLDGEDKAPIRKALERAYEEGRKEAQK